jgi:uncharacterized protein YegP (UPF0339 family)
MTKPLYTFEVFRSDANGEWYWRITHRNGNIVAVAGEGYTRKAKALSSARRLAKGFRNGIVIGLDALVI